METTKSGELVMDNLVFLLGSGVPITSQPTKERYEIGGFYVSPRTIRRLLERKVIEECPDGYRPTARWMWKESKPLARVGSTEYQTWLAAKPK